MLKTSFIHGKYVVYVNICQTCCDMTTDIRHHIVYIYIYMCVCVCVCVCVGLDSAIHGHNGACH